MRAHLGGEAGVHKRRHLVAFLRSPLCRLLGDLQFPGVPLFDLLARKLGLYLPGSVTGFL